MSRFHVLVILIISIMLFSCASNKRKEEERLRRIREASAYFHIEQALAASDSGKYEAAIKHLRKAISIAPWEPSAHNNMGAMFFNISQMDSAIYYYRAALRLRPTYTFAYINLAQVYVAQKNYQMAHLALNNGLEYNPKAYNLYLTRASIYEEQKLYDEAILNYNRALVLDPENDRAYNNLGTIYYLKGMLRESIENYEKALEINPNRVESLFNLGNAYAKKCEAQEAVNYFSQALELDPNLPSALNNRGLVYTGMGNQAAAIADFKAALKIDPQSQVVPFNLSIAYHRMDSLDIALDYVNMALQRDSSKAEFFLNKGTILIQLGQPKAALENYSKAINLSPEMPVVYNNIGNVYSKVDNVEEAQKSYEKAVELFPDFLEKRYFTLNQTRSSGQADLVGSCQDPQVLARDYAGIYNNLGKIYLRQNSINNAIAAFKRAMELNPVNPEIYENIAACYQMLNNAAYTKSYMAMSNLAWSKHYFQMDSLNAAMRANDAALQQNPHFPDALAMRGLILEKQGEIDKATELFGEAFNYQNIDSDVYFAYGNFLGRRGEWTQAAEQISNGLRIRPASFEGRKSLANAFNQLGLFEQANREQAKVHYLTGKKHEFAGQWDSALDEYITAMQLDSTQADYPAGQGLIFAKKHEHETAELFLHKALELDTQNAGALYGMGLILGDQQKNEQAIEYLTKSIQSNPSEPQVYYVLAVNYYFTGQLALAWEQIRQAQELGLNVNPEFIKELERSSAIKNN